MNLNLVRLIFGLLISLLVSTAPLSQALAFTTLKTGDLLLESVPCFMCSLIELEENSAYSHVGIAVVEKENVSVLEAWQKVERVTFDQFNSKRKKNTSILVLRAIDRNSNEIHFSNTELLAVFDREFNGKSYDSDFLWNNFDEKGEKFYCSEFVLKILNQFLPVKLQTKPMHFDVYRDYWIKYFGGLAPDSQPGVSPGDFEKSSSFKPIRLI